jgi:hypothetical protein
VLGEWIRLNDRMRIRPFEESFITCLLCGWSTVTKDDAQRELADHTKKCHAAR